MKRLLCIALALALLCACGIALAEGLRITRQPADVTSPSGTTVTLQVAAEGSGLSYQWQTQQSEGGQWLNTSARGYNTDTLQLQLSQNLEGRRFRCVVSDDSGNMVISDAAVLHIGAAPAVTPEPAPAPVQDDGSMDIPLPDSAPEAPAESAPAEEAPAAPADEQPAGEANPLAGGLAILYQPRNVTLPIGMQGSFHVEAIGAVSYQWEQSVDWNPTWRITSQEGSHTDTLRFTVSDSLNGRHYRCRITGEDGTEIYSDVATLVIGYEPTALIAQPTSLAVGSGKEAVFRVVMAGTGLSYQWQTRIDEEQEWQDTKLDGCTTDTLRFTAKLNQNLRQYRCQVTDWQGNQLFTDAVTLWVSEPTISAEPQDVHVQPGELAVFTVDAFGVEPLSYRWQTLVVGSETWQDTQLPGFDTPALKFPAQNNHSGRKYRVIVTDVAGGSMISEAATLTVGTPEPEVPADEQPAEEPPVEEQPAGEQPAEPAEAAGPVITLQPEDQLVGLDALAEFTVVAEGSEPLSYQWQTKVSEDGAWQKTKLEGFDTDTLVVKAEASRDGRLFRCVVTDSEGNSSESEAARLTIGEAAEGPAITLQPEDAAVPAGGTAVYTVKAEGEEPLSFRWQTLVEEGGEWQDTKLSGYDTDTLSVLATKGRNGRMFRCIVTDAQGHSSVSEAVLLTVE